MENNKNEINLIRGAVLPITLLTMIKDITEALLILIAIGCIITMVKYIITNK